MPRTLTLPTWENVQYAIVGCELCPRLRKHCTTIAQVKRAAFKEDTYWGKPIPNLGDADAHLLIIGLAPAAHGGNRTGRMFTGDRSGDFLFEAMHAEGFCNQPDCRHVDDGLRLIDCAITATAHCAPPANKPTPLEIGNCRRHLDATVSAMPALAAGRGGVLVLGKIAFDAALAMFQRRKWIGEISPRSKFGHAALFRFPQAPFLVCSYHPSQQNTFTGKLTQPMLRSVFRAARRELDAQA